MSLRGFAALARKDVRELGPLIVAMVSLILVYLFDSVVLSPADAQPCVVLGWFDGSGGSATAFIPVVVGLVVASVLLAGEHEQGTIEFLQALPVTRRAVFLTKFVVGALVLLLIELGHFGVTGALCLMNPESMSRRQLQPGQVWLALGLDSLLQLFGLCHGMLLAFFRRLGWVLLLLVFLGLRTLQALNPDLSIFNLTALIDVEHFGTRPIIPWSAWVLHTFLAAGALALAARLWLTRADRFAVSYQRLVTGPGLRRVAVTLAVMGAVAIATATVHLRVGGGDDQPPQREAPTATLETRHFHFTYRRADQDRARMLAQQADQSYEQVRALLGAPATEVVIADLTDSSNEHAGLAGWQRMRMDIGRRHSDAFLRYVLRHESAHVLAEALAKDVAPARWSAARFFHEGLADYLAYQLWTAAEGENPRAGTRRLAAFWRSRFRLDFEALQDAGSFLTRHPEQGLYAFGELWVATLVQTCGTSIPARVIRRLADPAIPRELRGGALWRQVLQREGCPFERVMSRYEGELRRLEPEAARLPVASARFLERTPSEGLSFAITLTAPGTAPLPVLLRVRDGPHSPPHLVVTRQVKVVPGEQARVTVEEVHLEGERFEYMVGALPAPEAHPVYTRWQSTSVSGPSVP